MHVNLSVLSHNRNHVVTKAIMIKATERNVKQLCRVHNDTPTEPNGEPVDKLCDGDKTDAKAKSTNPSKA